MMNLDEIKRRLRKIVEDAGSLRAVYVSTRDAEAIEAALREIDATGKALADAASTLIIVAARRDVYRDMLRKIKAIVSSAQDPSALIDILNLVNSLDNLGDAAQPQKEPS